MDENKKKIVLVAVAVLALGAAGYTMFGGSGGGDQRSGPAAEFQRAERPTRDTASKDRTSKRPRRTAAAPVRKTLERADRSGTEQRQTASKSRRSAGRKLAKKKKLAPAS